MNMRRALVLLLPFLLLWPLGGQSGKESGGRPIIFILDASGSMAEDFGGVSRMVAARSLLRQHMNRLGVTTPLGLVAYGNRIPGCRSHRLYSRVQPGNQDTIAEQIEKMVPEGSTPLAATLKLVKKTLIPQHPDANIVIISDGAESCGGNPARVARELRSKNKDLKINVIGLQLNARARQQLSEVAESGNGRYFQVNRPGDFARAIQESTGLQISKPTPGRLPGGWREPEEPYLVDPIPPKRPNDPHESTPTHDPHESYDTYEHPDKKKKP